MRPPRQQGCPKNFHRGLQVHLYIYRYIFNSFLKSSEEVMLESNTTVAPPAPKGQSTCLPLSSSVTIKSALHKEDNFLPTVKQKVVNRTTSSSSESGSTSDSTSDSTSNEESGSDEVSDEVSDGIKKKKNVKRVMQKETVQEEKKIDGQDYGMDVDLPAIPKNVFADKGEFF